MKALFFLRHYNDIDHITPVIFKWIESGHTCDIVLIGSPSTRSDYRIEFLSQLVGVRVDHIRDLLPPIGFMKWRLQTLLLAPSIRRLFIHPFVNVVNQIYDAKKRQRIWKILPISC